MFTRPSWTTPIAPVCGEPKGSAAVESILRTSRAGCTRPAKTTTTPSPSPATEAARATASARLAGPSAPGALAGRMAPVKTMGGAPA